MNEYLNTNNVIKELSLDKQGLHITLVDGSKYLFNDNEKKSIIAVIELKKKVKELLKNN